jgi:hypothetical protein
MIDNNEPEDMSALRRRHSKGAAGPMADRRTRKLRTRKAQREDAIRKSRDDC